MSKLYSRNPNDRLWEGVGIFLLALVMLFLLFAMSPRTQAQVLAECASPAAFHYHDSGDGMTVGYVILPCSEHKADEIPVASIDQQPVPFAGQCLMPEKVYVDPSRQWGQVWYEVGECLSSDLHVLFPTPHNIHEIPASAGMTEEGTGIGSPYTHRERRDAQLLAGFRSGVSERGSASFPDRRPEVSIEDPSDRRGVLSLVPFLWTSKEMGLAPTGWGEKRQGGQDNEASTREAITMLREAGAY